MAGAGRPMAWPISDVPSMAAATRACHCATQGRGADFGRQSARGAIRNVCGTSSIDDPQRCH
jgi:hypothetical protein